MLFEMINVIIQILRRLKKEEVHTGFENEHAWKVTVHLSLSIFIQIER